MSTSKKECISCAFHKNKKYISERGYAEGYICTNKSSDYYDEFTSDDYICDQYKARKKHSRGKRS